METLDGYATMKDGRDVKLGRVRGDETLVWWIGPNGEWEERTVPTSTLTPQPHPSWVDPSDL